MKNSEYRKADEINRNKEINGESEKRDNINKLSQNILNIKEQIDVLPYTKTLNRILEQHPNWKSSLDENFKILSE